MADSLADGSGESSLLADAYGPSSILSLVADVSVVASEPTFISRVSYQDARRLLPPKALASLVLESISWRGGEGLARRLY